MSPQHACEFDAQELFRPRASSWAQLSAQAMRVNGFRVEEESIRHMGCGVNLLGFGIFFSMSQFTFVGVQFFANSRCLAFAPVEYKTACY